MSHSILKLKCFVTHALFSKNMLRSVVLFYQQCCQLFAELFGQSRRKIWPLRTEIRTPSNFHLLKEFGLRKTLVLSVLMVKHKLSWTSPGIREDKWNNFIKVLPLFCTFCSKSAKIRPQICPAGPLFIRPFLTNAAQQSDSWQHWLWDPGVAGSTVM